MVLFKRKNVVIPPPKYTPLDPDQSVWVIPETLEYFVSYDEYLERLDFYNNKKFICELSGASCLSFFEARLHEQNETESVLEKFPDPLKKPILEKVQFSLNTRLDQLVDEIYGWLKERFFIGEVVSVRYVDQRVRAQIIYAENGVYRVDDGKRILEGDSTQLLRDRKIVSKLTLRAFVKHAASREQWMGAPWIVRSDYVTAFDLATKPPPEVARVLKAREEEVQNGYLSRIESSDRRQGLRAIAPAPQGEDRRKHRGERMTLDTPISSSSNSSSSNGSKYATGGEIGNTSTKQLSKLIASIPDNVHFPDDDLFMMAKLASHVPMSQYVEERCKSYPWPEWHVDPRLADLESLGKINHIFEIWMFMQLYSDLLGLKSSDIITFDAFVEGLSSHEMSEQVVNLHTAVLSMLVKKGGVELTVRLPVQAEKKNTVKRKKRSKAFKKRRKTARGKEANGIKGEEDGDDDDDMDDEDDEDEDDDEEVEEEEEEADEEEEEEEDEEEDEAVDDEDKAQVATGNDTDDEDEASSSENETNLMQAWTSRIGRREYENGGWQSLVADVLSDLCYLREWHPDTRAVVEQLKPSYQVTTLESVSSAYSELSLANRVHALMMLVRTLYNSSQLRDYLDDQYDQQLKLRKRPFARELRQLKEDVRSTERVIANLKSNGQHDNEEESKGTSNTEEPQDMDISLEKLEERAELLKRQLAEKTIEAAHTAKEIAKLDKQRFQLLGKDRFFNRYWWLDGNGVAGLFQPEDERDYAMGRLCVQGPSSEDLQKCLNSEVYAEEFALHRQRVCSEIQRFKVQQSESARLKKEAQKQAKRRSEYVSAKSNSIGAATPIQPHPRGKSQREKLVTPIINPKSKTSPGISHETFDVKPQDKSLEGSPKKNTEPAKNAELEDQAYGIEQRLRELLSINSRNQGLNEDQLAELRELQEKASKLGSLAKFKDHFPQANDAVLEDKQASHAVEPVEIKPQKSLNEKHKKLKQAQEQVQLKAQIAARVQAHFDAEAQASSAQNGALPLQDQQQPSLDTPQAGYFTQQPNINQTNPLLGSAPPPVQVNQEVHAQTHSKQPPEHLQAQNEVGVRAQVQPPIDSHVIAHTQAQQLQQHVYAGYPADPNQQQVQWVIQQTAYGPMIYAIPIQQYQMLMQQYLPQPHITPGAEQIPMQSHDAYQAYLQQVAIQQSQYYQQPVYTQYPVQHPVQHPVTLQSHPLPAQLPPLQVVNQGAPQAPLQAPPQEPMRSNLQSDSLDMEQATMSRSVQNAAQPHTQMTPTKVLNEGYIQRSEQQLSELKLAHSTPGPLGPEKKVFDPVKVDAEIQPVFETGNKTILGEKKDSPSDLRKSEVNGSDVTGHGGMEYSGEAKHTDSLKHVSSNTQDEVKTKTELANTQEGTENKVEVKVIEPKLEDDETGPKLGSFLTGSKESTADLTESSGSVRDTPEPKNAEAQEPKITPLDLLDVFENKKAIMSPNQWRFYETPAEFDQLMSYLIAGGSRESQLITSLKSLETDIKCSMELRLRRLNLADDDNASDSNLGSNQVDN